MNALQQNVAHVPDSDLLGEIVTWDMPGREVAYSDVLEALRAAGMPESLARDMRYTTAFGRACKEFRANRSIDRVSRHEDLIQFQFTSKYLEASGVLEFSFEAMVNLDCSSGEIRCEESEEIEDLARKAFAHALEHRTTSDVTRMVQTAFMQHADLFPINPKKGVAYFVPTAHREFCERVESFLASMGGKLLRFPVPRGTEEGNASVKDAVESGLRTMLAELEETVGQWTARTKEGTMDKAVDRWKQIKHKCEAYAEYLGVAQSSLLAAIDKQKAALVAQIDRIQAEQAAKAA